MTTENRRGRTYQNDNGDDFPGHYKVAAQGGVAWYVLGWEVEPVAVFMCDCGWMGIEREGGGGKTIDEGDPKCDHENAYQSDESDYERTGNVLATMVGDNGIHSVDPDDLTMIPDDSYCGECGQIGCGCYVTV